MAQGIPVDSSSSYKMELEEQKLPEREHPCTKDKGQLESVANDKGSWCKLR